ncbi:hypothetical protein [Bdellovibrio sp.]|uniref:hypothetical protein n=1 Tax=Bdellovibrio sp. TaxID=28201 RepID=UPI0039E35EF6
MKPLLTFLMFALFLPLCVFAQTEAIIQSTVQSLSAMAAGDSAQVFFSEKVKQVETPTHTQLIAIFSNGEAKLKLIYDSEALKKPELFVKDLCVLKALSSRWEGSYHYMLVETFFNAQHGSLSARYEIMKLGGSVLRESYLDSLETLKNQDPALFEKMRNQIALEKETSVAQIEEAKMQAEADTRRKHKELLRYREQTQLLEKYESMSDKLNDLILKNDRAGVRKMLEAYLPWSVMEPMEAKTWKVWLDAIENPDPSRMTVAFRGVDYTTDKVQRLKMADGSEHLGFMSTVLTKNQGSYTRRLRSLTTNRSNGLKTMTSFLTTETMSSHAGDPKASSYISFTLSPWVAHRFVGSDKALTKNGFTEMVPNGGLLAVKMDSRRLLPNIISSFSHEVELLAPLIVFPDEVVKFREGALPMRGMFEEQSVEKMKAFIEDVRLKTGVDFSQRKPIFSPELKTQALNFFEEAAQKPLYAPRCSGIFN